MARQNNNTNFLQKVFNDISLQRNEKIWLSADDKILESRLKLLAEFQETQFNSQFKLDCVSNAKNGKLSSALREKGNLSYAQGDCESALRLYNQVLLLQVFFFLHTPIFWQTTQTFWKRFFNREREFNYCLVNTHCLLTLTKMLQTWAA